jgi:hypothetical protein
MSIQVIIHEAKGLSGLSGRIKVRVAVLESTGSGYSQRDLEGESLAVWRNSLMLNLTTLISICKYCSDGIVFHH